MVIMNQIVPGTFQLIIMKGNNGIKTYFKIRLGFLRVVFAGKVNWTIPLPALKTFTPANAPLLPTHTDTHTHTHPPTHTHTHTESHIHTRTFLSTSYFTKNVININITC